MMRAVSVATLVSIGHAVTPTEKVVELLADLTKDVEAEGVAEAKQAKEYAKFCRRTVDEKAYLIDKNTKKLTKTSADVTSLTAEIKELDGAITDLKEGDDNGSMEDLAKQIEDLNKAREDAVKEYDGQAKEMVESISRLDRAIKVLSATQGKVEKVDFLQLSKEAEQILDSSLKLSHLKIQPEQLSMLEDLQDKPGQPAVTSFKSRDVISMLKGLLVTFKENKESLDMDELKAKGNYQKSLLNLNNLNTIAKKTLSEKKSSRTDKKAKLAQTETDKADADAAKKADEAFKKELEEDCKEKADLAAQRSKVREGELEALATATAKLKEIGISLAQVPSQGKLKQIQRVDTASDVVVEAKPTSSSLDGEEPVLSFVQLRGTMSRSKMGSKMARSKIFFSQPPSPKAEVLSFIAEKANAFKSTSLALAAVQFRATDDDGEKKDNFVKLREVIRGLFTKMEAKGKEEADTKAMCDEQVEKLSKNRDDAQGAIETASTNIATFKAKVNQLTDEVATLEKTLADDKASLAEATTMREEEKAENEKTIADAKLGEDGSAFAIKTLKDFYDGAAFMQTGQPQGAKDSSGKRLGDMAPTFEATEEYKGNSKSKGVLGMLDVIHTDFVKTKTDTTKAEEKAATDFTKLKEDTEKAISDNTDSVTKKNTEIKSTKEDLVTEEGKFETQTEKVTVAKDGLDKLRAMCTNNEESYAIRKQKREEEIASLQETLAVVNEMIKEEEE
eukprot:TRINITY_DN79436_c0_g1_i1.p1 TRINITY_DN79436_c0_g1~~TRINITY_DN79436_c0_g1_i1.p1  ORF type:complete len:732 (+),score=229.46 TRINITY_DN79436_c0_g1_i1:106-2301(+)